MTANLTHTLLDLFTTFGYVGIVLAMAIESCCIPLPSELVMPLAGFLAFEHRLNLFGAGLAGAVGCVVGSLLAYWIGAAGGRPLLLRYGRYVLISHEDAARADDFFARHGEVTIFVTRLLPIIRTFISLPAGIARMSLGKFVVFTFVGSLIWCVALAFVGYQLGQHWERISTVFRGADVVIAIGVLALIGLFLYRHLGHGRST